MSPEHFFEFSVRFHGGFGHHIHHLPGEDVVGGWLLRVHDALPDFLPDGAKWTVVVMMILAVVAPVVYYLQKWLAGSSSLPND